MADTSPVDIVIGDVHYRVPKNYLETFYTGARLDQREFTAVTLYPKMLGARVDGANGAAFSTRDRGAWPNDRFPDAVRFYASASEIDPNTVVFNAVSAQPGQPWRFGLLESRERSVGNLQVLYSPPKGKYAGFVAFCEKGGGQCGSTMHPSPKNLVRYLYLSRQLEHWAEFQSGVEGFVHRLIVSIDDK